MVAENVAEAPSAPLIHSGWMESEHHRANLLDPRLDRVAIGVLERGGQLFAVEDFDRGVAAVSLTEQERAVASLLTEVAPLTVGIAAQTARATCAMETGFAGERRPWFVMRFTTASLGALPQELRRRLQTGRYHEAEVGACPLRGAGSFSGHRSGGVAVSMRSAAFDLAGRLCYNDECAAARLTVFLWEDHVSPDPE